MHFHTLTNQKKIVFSREISIASIERAIYFLQFFHALNWYDSSIVHWSNDPLVGPSVRSNRCTKKSVWMRLQIEESESNQFAATASLIPGLVVPCTALSSQGDPHESLRKMAVKEEISLLPSSVKSLPGVREGNVSIKRSFQWLLIATLALIFGWLVLLSARSYQPTLSEELVNRLMRGQEV